MELEFQISVFDKEAHNATVCFLIFSWFDQSRLLQHQFNLNLHENRFWLNETMFKS
jgi:hypothetical protein